MDIAASAIAFGQAVNASAKLGHELVQRYKAYKHADSRLEELIIRTEGSCLKTSTQLELLERIKDELDPKLVEFFDACLARLEIKLRLARDEIDALINDDSSGLALSKLSFTLRTSKKARYSAFERHIRKTISELQEWHLEFDPSWLFVIRLTSPKVDLALENTPQNKPEGAVLDSIKGIRAVLRDIENDRDDRDTHTFMETSFVSTDRTLLPASSLAMTTTTNPKRSVLLDTTTYPKEAKEDDVLRQVRDLARILMHGEPSTLGLLQCLGVLKIKEEPNASQQYQLIYAIPTDLEQPATLRRLLIGTSASLDTKFHLARSMARGVASVHAAGFVHKSVRPETILTFHTKNSLTRTAFLVGFERFRREHEGTAYIGDMVWHRNLYRHPLRQGQHPETRYQMQHDIYSLGVCLLELGLWESFVIQIDPPKSGSSLQISDELSMRNQRQAGLGVKKKLIKLAEEKLPAAMGLAYTVVVMSCLTCLDSDTNNMFANSNDLRDHDGILVGVAFIEKILTRLISVQFSV